MIDETEQRAAPPEPTIVLSQPAMREADDRPITPETLPQLRLGRGLGNPSTCGATPWASTPRNAVAPGDTFIARFG